MVFAFCLQYFSYFYFFDFSLLPFCSLLWTIVYWSRGCNDKRTRCWSRDTNMRVYPRLIELVVNYIQHAWQSFIALHRYSMVVANGWIREKRKELRIMFTRFIKKFKRVPWSLGALERVRMTLHFYAFLSFCLFFQSVAIFSCIVVFFVFFSFPYS